MAMLRDVGLLRSFTPYVFLKTQKPYSVENKEGMQRSKLTIGIGSINKQSVVMWSDHPVRVLCIFSIKCSQRGARRLDGLDPLVGNRCVTNIKRKE